MVALGAPLEGGLERAVEGSCLGRVSQAFTRSFGSNSSGTANSSSPSVGA